LHALLVRAAENDLVARGSFFQRDFIRKQREAGLPLHLIAHEDVLLFRTAQRRSAGSGISTELQNSRSHVDDLTRPTGNPRGDLGVSRNWAV
jgi:hypothetical protein